MTKNIKNKLVLVDGSSYLFRAYHALPYLTNNSGEHTGAILGVINMLRKLPSQLKTDYVCVVFDAKGKNFRHELYSEYKANRKKMADELQEQVQPLHKLIQAMGFPLLSIPGVEADDVIGTLVKNAIAENWQVVVSTGDKDMAQLVTKDVTLMDTMKNQTTGVDEVKTRFGVTPNQIIDYLALMGDVSDNIPGVPKVGPKTAAKWINDYGSLKGVIENAATIKGKVGENLRESVTFLPLSYQLATIKCDLDINCKIGDLHMQRVDESYLLNTYKRYQFKNLIKELEQNKPVDNELIATESAHITDYDLILEHDTLQKWLDLLKQSSIFAIDTETTSVNPMEAELVGISFAISKGKAAYLPLTHDYLGAPKQLDFNYCLEKLTPILEEQSILKIGQNIKYDLKILARYNIVLQGVAFDTMLESYVYNSSATRHNMDALAKKYLQCETIKFEDVAGKGKKQLTFDQVDIPTAALYAAEDADITLRLHNYLYPKLKNIPSINKLFMEEEMPVMFVLDRIERTGVKIDSVLLAEQSKSITFKLSELEEHAQILAKEKFNLASAKQLREILFTKLEIPVVKKTPGGVPSTSEEVLQELAEVYELPALILQHRHLSKLKSTYTDKLPLMVNTKTGRVHTSYHQAVAITGRLSSSDPNLQNIPIRSEVGRKIREAFISEPGFKIMAVDYSQVELRIMAHLSKDDNLVAAFNNGDDIHSATAAETLGINITDVSSEQRRKAKAVNFGLIYGMSAFGLAKQLKISRTDAQEYVDIYFNRYPGIKEYMHKTREFAKTNGYVETLFGRRLYLPDIEARNIGKRRAAERAAINAPMQGTAADIIKRAMLTIDKWCNKEAQNIKMIMQVHDELVFEVKDNFLKEAKENIKNLMESAANLAVPLLVDVGVGDNWNEAH